MLFPNDNHYKNHIYQDLGEFTMIYIVHDYEKRDTVPQFLAHLSRRLMGELIVYQ